MQSVADVDSGGTDRYAATTIHTVSDPLLVRFSAWLSALAIVANHHGIGILHDGLKSTVRTDDEAELLAEPEEVPVQNHRHHHAPQKRRQVRGRTFFDHPQQLFRRYKVRQKQMRQDVGHDRVDQVLGTFAQKLFQRHRTARHRFALAGRTFDEPLNSTEHTFQKHRLRTGPAAPHATEQRSQQNQGKADSGQDEKGQIEILRIEHATKQKEASRGNV